MIKKKKVLIRLKLMQRDMINGKVVKLKITGDITKLVFDQIRINGIKKKEEYRTSCKIVLTTLTKLTKKKQLFFNTFYFT